MYDVEMTDITGWQQSPETIRVPSPMEVAIVSGRICRYAGNLPCALLTHVMVGARVVWHLLKLGRKTKAVREQTFAWWMLHDAHEVITGDFASHKCDEMKAWQSRIDDAVAAEYCIDRDRVDEVIVHSADMLSRWLEAKHYGTPAYLEAFEETNTYEVPSPAMQRETVGVFRSDFGRMSRCVVDENGSASASGPVMSYASILDRIMCGDVGKAIEIYDGMVVEIGV